VEITFKVNGIPLKTFPNFEMKLNGDINAGVNIIHRPAPGPFPGPFPRPFPGHLFGGPILGGLPEFEACISGK